MLNSGVPLLKALEVAGGKAADARTRQVFNEVILEVRKGQTVCEAFRRQAAFPELVLELVDVAEQTGALPEVMSALADHYDNLLRQRATFLAAIAWPVIQLVMAVFIIAGLLIVLGWVAESNGGKFDPLGFGLKGTSGALTWLGLCGGTVALLWGIYQFVTRGFRQGPMLYRSAQRIPVVGTCLRDFALARFSWSFALTQQAGMPIRPSLESSLKATGNPAYAVLGEQVVTHVMAGDELSDALEMTNLFPQDYLEMVRVGETSGTVPETLQKLSPQLEQQARRSLSALSDTFGWLVWAMVAGMIIFLVFRIALWYVNLISAAAGGNFDAFE
jgi:type IV pilus assembly protein PilC